MNKPFFVIGLAYLVSAHSLFAQWQPDQRLTFTNSSSHTEDNKAPRGIGANGDTVHLVWYELGQNNDEIYYKKSLDAGQTWLPEVRLTNAVDLSTSPAIAVNGNNVYVTWLDERNTFNEVFYRRSTDGGTTWGPEVILASNSYAAPYPPAIASSGPYVFVIWPDERSGASRDFYMRRSTDYGATWAPETLLTYCTTNSEVSIACVDSYVYITWWNSDLDICFKRSTNYGLSWSSDMVLTSATAISWQSVISASGSNVCIVWEDTRNDIWGEIYAKYSSNHGNNWSSDIRLTSESHIQRYPNVYYSLNNIHVVWEDYRDGNAEIYYKVSTNNGISWSTEERLTNAAQDSRFPEVVADNSAVHVAWHDLRDGNEEIYYKRNPNGNVSIEDNRYQKENNQLKIIPNPFVNWAVIHGYENVLFTIYDASGRSIGICKGEKVGAELSPGVYFVNDISKKLGVQRIVKIE